MVGEQEAARKSFFVAFVPADAAQPLAEWSVALPEDKEAQIGCLTERLRAHFKASGGGASSTQEQQEIFKKQILSQLPAGASMSDDMLQMMLQMDSLVDSVPLVLNTPAVQHVSVNLYVDDKGTAKGLPVNARASAIVQACGKMLEVRGDAFIGRVFDNDDDFVRMDFRLDELSTDAEWVQIAKQQAASSAATAAPAAAAKRRVVSSLQRVCAAAMCSKDGTLRCSRCKNQYYCSAACQKADWKTHKASCAKA